VDAFRAPEIDPFGEVSSPSLYVMRDATERALSELVGCGSEPAILVGPPGIGKSLLLQVAAKSVEGVGPCVFVSFPSLDTKNLCCWILDELRCPRFEDPVFAFEAYLAHLREIGTTLLLQIDDLHLMPAETIASLGRWVVASEGELRLIASAINDPQDGARFAPLGPACRRVAIQSPMEQEESSQYVHGRLDLAGAPEATRKRFNRSTVSKLHRVSGGVPRELNLAAAELLRAPPPPRGSAERFLKWWRSHIRE
jgi:type II secretory pathway predicted ATPase ExeA